MALVAYDSSDTSDVDDEEFSSNSTATHSANEKCSQRLPDISKETFRDWESSAHVLQRNNLFETLPKPAQNKLAEEDDAFLHKKETLKKAKIAIPSLSEFKDIEDGPPVKKYSQGNERKSGLLSILPEPKFSGNSNKKPSKPLIPNVVERKVVNINPSPSIKKPGSTKANVKNSGNSLLSADYSDSEDDDNDKSYTGKDFFSIDSQQEQILLEDTHNGSVKNQYDYVAAVSSESMLESGFSNTIYGTKDDLTIVNIASSTPSEETYEYTQRIEIKPSSSNDLQLDDEAIRQLCGSRKRHRKEDIQLINVDQEQVLSDSREWLVKGLMDDTSKRVSASKRRGNEPTSQQKRKHQITYLAHQAKANEAELQNQWANNRVSKRQTQSKYGF